MIGGIFENNFKESKIVLFKGEYFGNSRSFGNEDSKRKNKGNKAGKR